MRGRYFDVINTGIQSQCMYKWSVVSYGYGYNYGYGYHFSVDCVYINGYGWRDLSYGYSYDWFYNYGYELRWWLWLCF